MGKGFHGGFIGHSVLKANERNYFGKNIKEYLLFFLIQVFQVT